MFGLEDKDSNKKKEADFVFDLEREMADPKKNRELKDDIQKKIQKLKNALRSGENKEEFDKHGMLLHGYTALVKVISRCEKKK